MASEHPDSWLWVGMVAIGYYAAWGIRRQLVLVRKAVEITNPEKAPDMVNQTVEDAIKLKTLGQLTESPNFDIREATIKIIKERVYNEGPAWDLLLQHLASSERSRRNKALISLGFLTLNPPKPLNPKLESLLTRPPFFTSLVTCLCNFLPEANTTVKNNTYPSEHQVVALQLVDTIFDDDLPNKSLERNIKLALDAGLVRKWLVRYPFCAASVTHTDIIKKRRDAIQQFLRTDPYDNCHPVELSHILRMLASNINGFEELNRYGLWGSSSGGEESEFGQRRRIEDSPEEVQLRRRRREAMVLGQEGRALRSSDIFERTDEIRDEDVEEELEELLEEVVEAEGRGDRGLRGLWDVARRLRPDGLAAS